MVQPTTYTTHIVGIDEAGRGPIAGPVSVGAVVVPVASEPYISEWFVGVNDSKLLTEDERERLYAEICSAAEGRVCRSEVGAHDTLAYAVSMVGARVIDRIGITRAGQPALDRSLTKLALNPATTRILLDGRLKAPAYFSAQETIVKGDQLKPIISLASIVAKVHRDHHMKRLARRYPDYGFERHKGYGTKAHYAALAEHGVTDIHRRYFLKKVP